jgi:cation transporter-like permease
MRENINNLHHHWHHVYTKRRKKRINVNAKQIMIGQVLALTGSLLAGYILELNKASLTLYAGAFLLLPGIVDLAASITGAMCAKINHRLDSGHRLSQVISSSVVFAFLLSATCSLIVGSIGGLIGVLFFNVPFWHIAVLAVATMTAVGLVSFPLMSLFTFLVRRTGIDPDNVVGPIETGFTDALTAFTVATIVGILL